ncbi:MAG: amino acid permease [Chlamydiae bacterium]|nr:amino acid permease [Chlamydiota bacterium]
MLPSVNGFYWFLTALCTGLYMIMYILMFLAAIRLHHQYRDRPLAFKIPGKTFGMWSTSLLGILGCTTTIVVSFFPPENILVGSHIRYLVMIAVANILAILPVGILCLYKNIKRV